MPVYRLTPIDTDDPNWSCSTHRGPCLVQADNKQKARDLATAEFKIAAGRNPGLTIPVSPWNEPQLVACAEAPDAPADIGEKEVRRLPAGGG